MDKVGPAIDLVYASTSHTPELREARTFSAAPRIPRICPPFAVGRHSRTHHPRNFYAADALLSAIQTDPSSWQYACHQLQQHASLPPVHAFFWMTVCRHAIKHFWHQLTPEQCQFLRQTLLTVCTSGVCACACAHGWRSHGCLGQGSLRLAGKVHSQ